MSTASETETEQKKLDLNFKIDQPGACERHVVVTIARAEIDRYFAKSFDEIAPKAEMPGFRVGKAPRKLLESRFRKQVTDQVKSSLVMDSLQQVTESGSFTAISEPDMDYGAVVLPDQGDFVYEFKIEVRPDFDVPKWQGLSVERPTYSLTDKKIDEQLVRVLARHSQGVSVDEAIEIGDFVDANVTFKQDEKVVAEFPELKVRVAKSLSFHDLLINNFGESIKGAREGEIRTIEVELPEDHPLVEKGSKKLVAEVEIIDVRRHIVDELNHVELASLGFQSSDEVRSFVREELELQFTYFQNQKVREQVITQLLKDADWDMPKELVKKQTQRELQRHQMEMQRAGLSRDEMQTRLNRLRQTSHQSTVRALREHFVLEKIAEEFKVEPSTEDYQQEIAEIAKNSRESVRVVQARIERTGQWDALRNQIVERQVLDKILEAATIKEVEDKSFLTESNDDFALGLDIYRTSDDMPEAQYDNRVTDGARDEGTVKLQS